jgi:hypothetical protein
MTLTIEINTMAASNLRIIENIYIIYKYYKIIMNNNYVHTQSQVHTHTHTHTCTVHMCVYRTRARTR